MSTLLRLFFRIPLQKLFLFVSCVPLPDWVRRSRDFCSVEFEPASFLTLDRFNRAASQTGFPVRLSARPLSLDLFPFPPDRPPHEVWVEKA